MTPLTDEQVCDRLLTLSAAPVQPDDAEVATLRSAVGSYRAETLQWAERRSATQPSLAARARERERRAALPRWSLATIAVVTIAAGVAHLSQDRDDPVPAAAPLTTVHETHSVEEIAADNKLLNSIDAELSYHGRSPVDAFNLKRPGTGETRSEE